MAGSDAAARGLFVEMQRQEAALLAVAFGPSKHVPEELWESRLQRILQWQASTGDRAAAPPLGSCATVLFLSSLTDANVPDATAMIAEALIQRPPIRDAVTGDNSESPVRKLVVGWLLNCPNKSEELLQRRLGLISMLGLADALPLPLAIISHDPQYLHVQPTTKAAAVLVIGQFGGRQHIDQLEPLLDDASVCVPVQPQLPNQPPAVVQVRDVALVVMLNLTGQSPADYGYTSARVQPPRGFQMTSLYRENDEQRADAIAKWRRWRAEHKDDKSTDTKPKSDAPPAPK